MPGFAAFHVGIQTDETEAEADRREPPVESGAYVDGMSE